MPIEIVSILLQTKIVGFSCGKLIKFKSGMLSPMYVDLRRLIGLPSEWRSVIDTLNRMISDVEVSRRLPFATLAGIETAGIPHAAALVFADQLFARKMVIVRKKTKDHGLGKRVEGVGAPAFMGETALIEDTTTTGGSALSGVEPLRELGAIVEHCFTIMSYGFPEAQKAFTQARVELHSLVTARMIVNAARDERRISDNEYEFIDKFLKDPLVYTPKSNP